MLSVALQPWAPATAENKCFHLYVLMPWRSDDIAASGQDLHAFGGRLLDGCCIGEGRQPCHGGDGKRSANGENEN